MTQNDNNSDNNNKHPYGLTLLSRDKPENLELWGPEGVGYQPVASTICTEDGQCPHYHYQDDAVPERTIETPIHLLIASYRDQLCPRTLHNAFSKAENPSRIYIRVIEQTLADSDLIDDAGCFDRYCTEYIINPEQCETFRSQVRIVHVDASQANGPTDARSKLSAMVHWDYLHRKDEDKSNLDFHPVELQDFCMQTDSHMDFSDHWDTGLIAMFHRTENDYAVLSTYVADISQNNQDVRTVPHLCMVQFTSTIRNWGTKECRKLVRPKLTNAMWGAGLSFHRCHAELVVPVDPYLDHVFDGEEGSRGIRFFTHGYDVYTPDRVLVTHDYHTHQSNPVVHTWGRKNLGNPQKDKKLPPMDWKFMKDIDTARNQFKVFGTERVNLLLGIGPRQVPKANGEHEDEATQAQAQEIEKIRSSRFGLGNKRSLEQAIEFTGIDLVHRKMVKNKCGNLLWVPFDESEDYGVPDILKRIPLDTTLINSGAVPQQQQLLQERPLDHAAPAQQAISDSTNLIGNVSIAACCALLFVLAGANHYSVLRKRRKPARHTN